MQACGALRNYGVHAVVANLLHTRKDQVLLVQRDAPRSQRLARALAQQLLSTPPQQDGLPVEAVSLHSMADGRLITASSDSGGESDTAAAVVLTIARPPHEPVIEVPLVKCITLLHQQRIEDSDA